MNIEYNPQCYNGQDDDEDGFTDIEDPDCDSAYGSETNKIVLLSDQFDK